jgi:geranylgeranyl diphosphate synthase, type II
MTQVASLGLHPNEAASRIDSLREMVREGLEALDLPDRPADLYASIRYVLRGGGKRLRPVLLLLAAESVGGDARRALPAALAVEIFHNFTLVHDDIMDQAAERRGRATVHVVWNTSTSILAGDLMMGMAYRQLARTGGGDLASLMETFSVMVAAVCEGQALDEAFERRSDVTVADYLDMIYRKTGALLVCALDLGAQVGGGSEDEIARLATAGRELGLAFQIQDDLLDLTASDSAWGKTIGGDLVQGKRTFLLLRALELAGEEDRAWFSRVLDRPGIPVAEVPEARRRMEGLGVLDEAASRVRRHSEEGIAALSGLPATPARDTLIWLSERLATRPN